MTKPVRIQRKRTKGWRMPKNTVYVGRPTKWGNPYLSAHEYRTWMLDTRFSNGIFEKIKKELKGKNLACWCSLDKGCHADVLLELAND